MQQESQVRVGDWRTLVMLWNTAVTGVFRAPAGAWGKLLG